MALIARNWFLLLPLSAIIATLPLFSSLTVEVDDEAVSLRFGVGLIHRRIALPDITAVRPVTTSWTRGWGIRFIRGGRLYNVSGFDAVELALSDGRVVQIGTDDQSGLLAAVEGALGAPRAASDAEPSADRTLWLVPAIIAGVGVLGAVMVILGMRPVTVTTSAAALDVSGAGYHAHVPSTDIVRVHLDETLPAIRYRSNGFAASGRLRGHFTLSDGRPAQLFVTTKAPPFITVDTRANQPVIFNTDDPSQTRALYAQLAR